jgi:hypothetical protein
VPEVVAVMTTFSIEGNVDPSRGEDILDHGEDDDEDVPSDFNI